MTLYLKYRSQTVEDLDLESVRETLKKIIRSDRFPHAFLFSGPKGTGKTSAARILAKVINCERRKPGEIEPCNQCQHCLAITKGEDLDVIEMDAASNRGIDDIRTLREAVKLSPVNSKKKVYIIDEAHMLTSEASNALLKTLEEPPDHVVFILATTNPEKLIETIRSRTSVIMFHKGATGEIMRSLERIAKGEKLNLTKEVSDIIAEAANGSFRDAHKILDQLLAENEGLTIENVEKFLKGSGFDKADFINLLIRKDVKACLNKVNEAVISGTDIEYLLSVILKELRQSLLAKSGIGEDTFKRISRSDLIRLLKLLTSVNNDLKSALLDQLPLEIAICEWCEGEPGSIAELVSPTSANGDKKDTPTRVSTSNQTDKSSAAAVIEEKVTVLQASPAVSIDANGFDSSTWTRVLAEVRPKNASTEALLRAAKPLQFDGKVLTIGVFYSFHKEKLEGNPHRILLEEVISSVVGKDIRIVCTLTAPPQTVTEKSGGVILTESKDKDIINIAKEVFEN